MSLFSSKEHSLCQENFHYKSNRVLTLQINKPMTKIYGVGWEDNRIFMADFPSLEITGSSPS